MRVLQPLSLIHTRSVLCTFFLRHGSKSNFIHYCFIEFNQKIMDKIGFSIRKSTLFNVLLIQRLKKKIKIALGVLVKKCVHLAPHIKQ